MTTLRLRDVWNNPVSCLAFGFGSGLMPKAPGTWGTVAAMPLYWIMSFLSWPVYAILTCVFFAIGVFVCGKAARDLGVHDDSRIVWDEIVGYLCTLFLAPKGLIWMLLGFGLFRLFDIWKPQPIRWLDARVHGGLGIMIDDVVAALFAWCVLQLLIWGVAS